MIDMSLMVISYYLAYAVRFDFYIPSKELDTMFQTIPLLLCVRTVTFIFFHMYRGMWRYTGIYDLINVIKAVIVSTMVVIMAVVFLYRFHGYPRSIFIIDCILLIMFLVGFRVGIRLYFSKSSLSDIFSIFPHNLGEGKRLLIIGAGRTGEKVLREIMDNPDLKLNPVGFLDDDLEKQGRTIHGIEVLGPADSIDSCSDLFDEILIAIPSASSQDMRRIVSVCERSGKRFLTIPGMAELIDGRISVRTARNVTMRDLLGRDEVKLSKEKISDYLHGKRVLITGAGGSIGSELVRQVSQFDPNALGLLEMSEFNLFNIEMECKQKYPNLRSVAFLTDVRDSEGVNRVFREFKPQVVFHAAAYKHVPMQELHPWEAVRNNIGGTKNLVNASCEFLVHKFVMVSTDKAVRPTNVMGATKRIAEKLVACASAKGSNPQFMVVRFGNVIGSSGSVIPTFQELIARGGPVTVTHPEITRFFMSIPEAAQLILEAGTMGSGGEIFILEMGKPVRIAEMAKDLIRLHGYQPDQDIAIEYVGLRPGEKLYEELLTDDENVIKTEHNKIMVIRGNICNSITLNQQIQNIIHIASTFDSEKIKQSLKEIVPEYTPRFG
jgi:FlaA1/EpsC-like NDP-sugar epimerase